VARTRLAGAEVGGVRDDQVGRIAVGMSLKPADQQPAEDQRPASLALVFEAVDLVLQGARVVSNRVNALDASK
jgi:hypothetical protein